MKLHCERQGCGKVVDAQNAHVNAASRKILCVSCIVWLAIPASAR